MKCAFKPSAPILNFSLRYEAGYSLELPAPGPNHWIIDTLLRLQIENTQEIPMYMASRSVLPPALSGAGGCHGTRFPLSPGTWRIGRTRHRRRRQDMSCQLARRDKRFCAGFRQSSTEKLRRINVLPPIPGPIYPASGQFSPLNVETLTGSLSALLRSLPAESARVVVFNLDREKESFRSERFQPAELDQAARAIKGAEGGTVDYANLWRPQSASEFLAGLIRPWELSGNRSLRCAGLYGSRRAAIPRAAPDDCGGWLTSPFLLHSIRRASVRGRICPRCTNRSNLQRWRHGKKLRGRPEACIQPSTSSGFCCPLATQSATAVAMLGWTDHCRQYSHRVCQSPRADCRWGHPPCEGF